MDESSANLLTAIKRPTLSWVVVNRFVPSVIVKLPALDCTFRFPIGGVLKPRGPPQFVVNTDANLFAGQPTPLATDRASDPLILNHDPELSIDRPSRRRWNDRGQGPHALVSLTSAILFVGAVPAALQLLKPLAFAIGLVGAVLGALSNQLAFAIRPLEALFFGRATVYTTHRPTQPNFMTQPALIVHARQGISRGEADCSGGVPTRWPPGDPRATMTYARVIPTQLCAGRRKLTSARQMQRSTPKQPVRRLCARSTGLTAPPVGGSLGDPLAR